jgi:hypothetical protein
MSDNQKQRVDSATCDVVSDAVHGNVDAVREWLHGDGRYNVIKTSTSIAQSSNGRSPYNLSAGH